MNSQKPLRKPRQLPPPQKKAEDDEPYITPLLNTVLGLGKQLTEARHWERIRAREQDNAAWDRRVWRHARRLVAKTKARERRMRRKKRARTRHAKRYHDARTRRRRKLTRNRMSMEQMIEMRDERRTAALKKGLLSRREGESREAFAARMRRINRRFGLLWQRHARGIRAAEPRYLEGWPVRDAISVPVIHSAEGGWVRTGTRACVQCYFRGLPCSLTRWRWKRGRDKGVVACTRCVRNGERHECVVPARGKEKENGRKWMVVDIDAKYPESVRKRETMSEELDAEVAAVVQRWKNTKKKKVVDIVGGRMEEIRTSAFVLPRPKRWCRRRGGW